MTSIQLVISADVTVGGVDQGSKSFTFDFQHDETPNIKRQCPAITVGIGPPCADIVTVGYNSTNSDTFDVNGTAYTLNVLGFIKAQDMTNGEPNPGAAPATQFISK
ncbi:choice-of-anchor K domain-containing protein [Candidatus Nitrosacidococcus sp. I8]|uniref:choice-of-anchor K domain-containing protein n=1 Tax=Candidatus Nitrosacidococcus sp. I8 TaxID=2942908 RepID=UPI0039B6EA46